MALGRRYVRCAGVECVEEAPGPVARLTGTWTLAVVGRELETLRAELAALEARPGLRWDCASVDAIDSTGAVLLWQTWGRKLPDAVELSPVQKRIFTRLATADASPPGKPAKPRSFARVQAIGDQALGVLQHATDILELFGQMVLACVYLCRVPREIPAREIGANIFKVGVKAMPVTALVGFLIGVVLSYLSSLQLKQFGAEVFIINILGLGVIRELGPLLVAVLVAGRSGSAMTAQLGVMRVTEEIEALAAMGVQRSLRLVFPKVFALGVAMPLLVLWTIAAALLGGMASAQMQLDISWGFFLVTLPKVVPVANLWLALVKGVAFGMAIALVACHFGLRVRPNTESLSANTTSSVVTAITVVILVDAVFAIVTRNIGL